MNNSAKDKNKGEGKRDRILYMGIMSSEIAVGGEGCPSTILGRALHPPLPFKRKQVSSHIKFPETIKQNCNKNFFGETRRK